MTYDHYEITSNNYILGVTRHFFGTEQLLVYHDNNSKTKIYNVNCSINLQHIIIYFLAHPSCILNTSKMDNQYP